jgi:hypothetical protein
LFLYRFDQYESGVDTRVNLVVWEENVLVFTTREDSKVCILTANAGSFGSSLRFLLGGSLDAFVSAAGGGCRNLQRNANSPASGTFSQSSSIAKQRMCRIA